MGIEASKEFQWSMQIKENAPSILKKELKNVEKGVVCIAGYQPVERKYRIIRKILEVLSSRKFPVHIITKSDIVLDDLDLLSRIAKNSWCAVSFTLATLDEEIADIFEPNAPSPKNRMEALGKVAEAGVVAGIALMPIIPHITDSNERLEHVISTAGEMKAKYVLPIPLTLEDNCRADFIEVIKKHFPEMLIKYRRLYEFGSAPDVRYSRRLKNKVRSILEKYGLEENVPLYDAGRKIKQVSIESY